MEEKIRAKVNLSSHTWALNDPGMDEYARAGLAGLYMSLTAADVWERAPLNSPVREQAKKLKELVSWNFPDDRESKIRLDWYDSNKTKEAFEAIVKWAWQVRDGVLFLPAVHRKQRHLDNYYLRLPTHNGLFSTFLQHNKAITRQLSDTEKNEIAREVQEKREQLEKDGLTEEKIEKLLKKVEKDAKEKFPKAKKLEKKTQYYDEDNPFTIQYAHINHDTKLIYWKKCGQEILLKGFFNPTRSIECPAWLYPGSAPRFGKSREVEKQWTGPARVCFLLAFAPLACHFTKLPKTIIKDKWKPNWSFIIPRVQSLSTFRKSALRHTVTLANWPFQSEVAGLQDAVLRYMAGEKLTRKDVTEVLAVVMGQVSHYQNQNVRKSHLRFSPKVIPKAIDKYRHFNRVFSASSTIKRGKVELPNCRERITANLLEERDWYRDLVSIPLWQSDTVRDKAKKYNKGESVDRVWFYKIRSEWDNLMTIINKTNIWSDKQDKRILKVFKKALWRLLNKEETAVSRGGSRELPERWDDKVDKIRRQLMRAKTLPLCRAEIIGLLGEATASHERKNRDGKKERVGGVLFEQDDEDDELSRYLWRMLGDTRDFAKVRDLALLALITFRDGRLG